jgi:hypothetical protein
MINIYIPLVKSKRNKPSIRGLWKDGNKLYYDYISQESAQADDIDRLQKHYKQLAMFYESDGQGYIYTDKDNIIILKNKTVYHADHKNIKRALKKIIAQYGGCTVYICKNGYTIEAWRIET